ncbi:MAG: class I SAM-dependent methyltransferase [Flavobacteriaceae bacterium]
MKKIYSPISGSTNVQKLNHFERSISSESKLINSPVDNYICLDTGLIFNQTGAREVESNFYESEYDLHSENDLSEFKYQTEKGFIGIYDTIIQFIFNNIKFKEKGNILDVGCGKGLLLKKFGEQKENWNLFGIEPSLNASLFYKKLIPEAEISNSNFENASLSCSKFDFICSNGVLEHVSEPVKFLRYIENRLEDQGYCFIGVPNFNSNPADLFTYDHLSRFTPETINKLFFDCGFSVIAKNVTSKRVPMWYLIKKTDKEMDFQVDVESERIHYNKHLEQMNHSFDSFQECIDQNRGEKIGVYGTGAVFLLSTLYRDIKFEDIVCFVDNNESIIGNKKYGVMINSPNYLKLNNINRIIVSSNPCYHEQIYKKIQELNLENPKIYL